jgi:hypothetical protein
MGRRYQIRKYTLQEKFRISAVFKFAEQCTCRASPQNSKSLNASRLVTLHCKPALPHFHFLWVTLPNLVRDATRFVIAHDINLQLQCAWFVNYIEEQRVWHIDSHMLAEFAIWLAFPIYCKQTQHSDVHRYVLGEAQFCLQICRYASTWTSLSPAVTLRTTRFNIQKYCMVITLHLCVLYGSQNSDICRIQDPAENPDKF